ncbi:MAG TPA: acyl-CoA dehydrogenase domain-containing protein, partial [Woeseiaceae bacterium]|nr:acyl-CoA dehydrogenase domain-containing protein [Woeseiaceae bacterium]
YSSPADELGQKIVHLITRSGEVRERLSQQAYTTIEPGNPIGLLQEALSLSETVAPLELRLRQARKEGLIQAEYLGHQIEEAATAEVISEDEAARLRSYHQKLRALMAVDDFAADDIGRVGNASQNGKSTDSTPTVRSAAKSKASAKKKTSARRKKAAPGTD